LLKKKLAKYADVNGKPMDPEKVKKLESFIKKFDENEEKDEFDDEKDE
jgi:hypothetical protein